MPINYEKYNKDEFGYECRVEGFASDESTTLYEYSDDYIAQTETDFIEVEVEGYTPKSIKSNTYTVLNATKIKPFSDSDIKKISDSIYYGVRQVKIPTFLKETGEIVENWEKKAIPYASAIVSKCGFIERTSDGVLSDEIKTIYFDITHDNNTINQIILPGNTTITADDTFNGYGFCEKYFKPRKSYNYNDDSEVVAFDGSYDIPPVLFFPNKIIVKDSNGNILLEKYANESSDILYVTKSIDDYKNIINNIGKYECGEIETNEKPMNAIKDINGIFYSNEYLQLQLHKTVLPENTREIIESYLELQGLFGKIGRDGIFKEISLENNMLYPAKNVFPSSDLYPGSNGNIGSELYTKKIYKKCIYSDEYTLPYGSIKCKYKNENGEETDYEYVIRQKPSEIGIVNPDFKGYLNYDLSNNIILKNNKYFDDDIRFILKDLAESIENIQYMPTKLSAKGLPYVEAGDLIQVIIDKETIKTYALRRTMKGIQQLQDSITAN